VDFVFFEGFVRTTISPELFLLERRISHNLHQAHKQARLTGLQDFSAISLADGQRVSASMIVRVRML
jgi:hypothetical protein